MEKYKDPGVFNNEYSKYVQHLASQVEDDTTSQSTAAFQYPSS